MSRCLLLWLFVCAAVLCVTADRHHSTQRDRREHGSHAERSLNYDSDDDGDSPGWKHSHDTWKPNEKPHHHNHQKRRDDEHKRDSRPENGRDQHDRSRRNRDEQDRQSENSHDRSKHRNGRHRDHGESGDRKRDHHHHQEHQHGHRHGHGGRYGEHDQHERYHRDRRSNEEHAREAVVTETVQPLDNTVYITDAESPETVTSAPAAEAAAAAVSPPTDEVETAPPAWTGQPPPHQDAAAMARYIVHVSDWVAMATISTRPHTRGMPFANVFSVADGTRYRSTGVPYMYLTDWEMSVKDLRVNNNASLTMSLAQSEYCAEHQYDPESPLCAHVILSGSVRQMDETEPDYQFAHDALFARHPEMASWPVGHQWFVALLEIQDIIVLDYFGGAITVPKKEYFAASPFTVGEGRETNLV